MALADRGLGLAGALAGCGLIATLAVATTTTIAVIAWLAALEFGVDFLGAEGVVGVVEEDVVLAIFLRPGEGCWRTATFGGLLVVCIQEVVDGVVGGLVEGGEVALADAERMEEGAVEDFVREDGAELGVGEGFEVLGVVPESLGVGAEGGDGGVFGNAEVHEEGTEEGFVEEKGDTGFLDAWVHRKVGSDGMNETTGRWMQPTVAQSDLGGLAASRVHDNG